MDSDITYYDFSGYSAGKKALIELPKVVGGNKKIRLICYYTVGYNHESKDFTTEWTVQKSENIALSTGMFLLIQGIKSSVAA